MIKNAMERSRHLRRRGGLYGQRALGSLALVLMHEWDALCGHAVELRERITLARASSGIAEFARNQLDLLQETRARLAMDHHERRALLHGLVADLRG